MDGRTEIETEDVTIMEFERKILNYNAVYYYDQFIKALESNNNQKIEETKVYELLIEMLKPEKVHFKTVLASGTMLYRGRQLFLSRDVNKLEVTDNELHGLNKYDSKEPPLHVATGGRNNIAGASYLYVAEDKYTAVAECKPMNKEFLSVAQFKVQRNLNMFNLCDDDKIAELDDIQKQNKYMVAVLITFVMRAFCSSAHNTKDSYRVSQYVSDLVRKHGYDGIVYKSFMSGGKNYTIFNCCESNISFVQSEVFFMVQQHFDVFALNDGTLISNDRNEEFLIQEQIKRIKEIVIKEVLKNRNGEGHQNAKEKTN